MVLNAFQDPRRDTDVSLGANSPLPRLGGWQPEIHQHGSPPSGFAFDQRNGPNPRNDRMGRSRRHGNRRQGPAGPAIVSLPSNQAVYAADLADGLNGARFVDTRPADDYSEVRFGRRAARRHVTPRRVAANGRHPSRQATMPYGRSFTTAPSINLPDPNNWYPSSVHRPNRQNGRSFPLGNTSVRAGPDNTSVAGRPFPRNPPVRSNRRRPSRSAGRGNRGRQDIDAAFQLPLAKFNRHVDSILEKLANALSSKRHYSQRTSVGRDTILHPSVGRQILSTLDDFIRQKGSERVPPVRGTRGGQACRHAHAFVSSVVPISSDTVLQDDRPDSQNDPHAPDDQRAMPDDPRAMTDERALTFSDSGANPAPVEVSEIESPAPRLDTLIEEEEPDVPSPRSDETRKQEYLSFIINENHAERSVTEIIAALDNVRSGMFQHLDAQMTSILDDRLNASIHEMLSFSNPVSPINASSLLAPTVPVSTATTTPIIETKKTSFSPPVASRNTLSVSHGEDPDDSSDDSSSSSNSDTSDCDTDGSSKKRGSKKKKKAKRKKKRKTCAYLIKEMTKYWSALPGKAMLRLNQDPTKRKRDFDRYRSNLKQVTVAFEELAHVLDHASSIKPIKNKVASKAFALLLESTVEDQLRADLRTLYSAVGYKGDDGFEYLQQYCVYEDREEQLRAEKELFSLSIGDFELIESFTRKFNRAYYDIIAAGRNKPMMYQVDQFLIAVVPSKSQNVRLQVNLWLASSSPNRSRSLSTTYR
jgi:hypothetical protein